MAVATEEKTEAGKSADDKAATTPKQTQAMRLDDIEKLLTDMLEEIEESKKALAAVESSVSDLQGIALRVLSAGPQTKAAPKFGTNRAAVKVLDTKNDELYDSKSAAGKATAADYGLDPTDSFVFYAIEKMDPTRFVAQA